MGTATNYLVEMRNITKNFPGVRALNNVDYNLKAGEVHVLLGENGAGKSTLIKILSGVYKRDTGTILLNGETVEIDSPYKAQALGISTIYQEFNLVPRLTVAENIYLGREPLTGKFARLVDWSKLFRDAAQLLGTLEIKIAPRLKVSDLSVAEKQMVEIAKALSLKAKILMLDEPTAVLSSREIDKLFTVIKQLKQQGVGIIYISHRLEEIPIIGDRITVLRDGSLVGTISAEQCDINALIKMMVGRELKDKYPARQLEIGEELLRVEGFNRKKNLHNISLNLHRAEILALAGLVGAGRTELARAIFGADKIEAGSIYVKGRLVQIKSPHDAIANRICYLPEERKTHGLILILPVKDNISLASLERVSHREFLDLRREKSLTEGYVMKLQIKTPSVQRQVMYLSGGNQQKVVIAKWMCALSDIFIFDEPTRGIDVGAKYEVYLLMNELVRQGAGIVMISSELPEILGMSDRVIVMRKGEVTACLQTRETNQEEILSYAWGQKQSGG